MTAQEARKKAKKCYHNYLGAMKWWWWPTYVASGWYEAYVEWTKVEEAADGFEQATSD